MEDMSGMTVIKPKKKSNGKGKTNDIHSKNEQID
jgi:hypothetical protein